MTSGGGNPNAGGGGGSGNSTLPYLGSKISLISYAGIRYEGVLFNINTRESTVGLSNVRSFGTEGRKPGAEVPACDDVFDFIVFRGKDIQDLTVTEPASHPQDPAIVAINPGPHMGGMQDYGHHHMHLGGGVGGGGGFGGPFSRMGGNTGGLLHHQHGGGTYQNSYNRRGGGRGRGYGGGYNSRTIVGELRPQPNQTLKSQLEQAFDFEEGNRRFEKVAANTTGDAAAGAGDNGKENEATGSTPMPAAGYNRAASFFDTISCEALDRQSGVDTRIDRQKQRVLDAATFGSAAALPIRRGRGYRRTNYRRNNNNSNAVPPSQAVAAGNLMNSLPQVGFSGRGRF